jgi:hypothetical protein
MGAKTSLIKIALGISLLVILGVVLALAPPATWIGYWGGNSAYPGTGGYEGGHWSDPPVCYQLVDTPTHRWTAAEKAVARVAIAEWDRSLSALQGGIIESSAPECHGRPTDIFIRWEDRSTFFRNWGDPNRDGKAFSSLNTVGFYVPIRIAPPLGVDPCADLKAAGFLDRCSMIILNWENPHGWFVDYTPTNDEEFEEATKRLCGVQQKVLKARKGGPADGKQDLYTVIKHEFGHALGLIHSGGCDGDPLTGRPPDDDGSVMWEGYLTTRRVLEDLLVGLNERRHLTDKDRRALRELYPFLGPVVEISDGHSDFLVWNTGIETEGPDWGDISYALVAADSTGLNVFIEVFDEIPEKPNGEAEFFLYIDKDSNPLTGFYHPVILGEMGIEYVVGAIFSKGRWDFVVEEWIEYSQVWRKVASIEGYIQRNTISFEAPWEALGESSPISFNCVLATYMDGVADILPDEGFLTLTTPFLFEDDFSDPTSGWAVYSDAEVKMGYEDGEYSILVKGQNLIAWSLNERAGTFKDFILEVDARQVSGPDNNDYGLLFRYQDEDNFYSFGVSGDGYYSLYKKVRGEWVAIVDWTESAYVNKGRSTNRLKVVAKGPEISLYVNDHFLTKVQDESIDEGYIGIYAGTFDEPYVHAHFDDLSVETAN